MIPFAKHRGRKSALSGMVAKAVDAFELFRGECHIWVAHADAAEQAEMLRDSIARQCSISEQEIPLAEVGPTISAHTGPGAVCFAMIPA